MDTFSRNELQTLMNVSAPIYVSLFLPTHPSAADTRRDVLTFKALLRGAKEKLLARGLSRSEVDDILEPVQRLEADNSFWQHRRNGLAVFVAANVLYSYHVPSELPQVAVAGNRFYIKPLLALLDDNGHFYILAFSQNAVKFFRATRDEISELVVPDLPLNLAEALKDEEPEKQLQYHTFSGGEGRDVAMYHGQGARVDDKKARILRYLRQIDEALHPVLRDERAPLVLAAGEYLFPIYGEANTYPYLLHMGVGGNPEHIDTTDLHRLAWAIVEPEFQKPQQEAAALYERLAGTARAANDLEQIMQAAYQGRVAVLFVPIHREYWGTFDPTTDALELHPSPLPADDDLVDLAAFYTLEHGGLTSVVEAPLAAIFRW